MNFFAVIVTAVLALAGAGGVAVASAGRSSEFIVADRPPNAGERFVALSLFRSAEFRAQHTFSTLSCSAWLESDRGVEAARSRVLHIPEPSRRPQVSLCQVFVPDSAPGKMLVVGWTVSSEDRRGRWSEAPGVPYRWRVQPRTTARGRTYELLKSPLAPSPGETFRALVLLPDPTYVVSASIRCDASLGAHDVRPRTVRVGTSLVPDALVVTFRIPKRPRTRLLHASCNYNVWHPGGHGVGASVDGIRWLLVPRD